MSIQLKIIQRSLLVKHPDGTRTQAPARIAMQVSRGRIPIETVAERIEKDTALGFGDVLSVLASLAPVVAEYASLGYSVDLGRLGTFTPRVTATAEPDAEKPYTVSGHVKGTNIRFTPARYLKDLTDKITYEL